MFQVITTVICSTLNPLHQDPKCIWNLRDWFVWYSLVPISKHQSTFIRKLTYRCEKEIKDKVRMDGGGWSISNYLNVFVYGVVISILMFYYLKHLSSSASNFCVSLNRSSEVYSFQLSLWHLNFLRVMSMMLSRDCLVKHQQTLFCLRLYIFQFSLWYVNFLRVAGMMLSRDCLVKHQPCVFHDYLLFHVIFKLLFWVICIRR